MTISDFQTVQVETVITLYDAGWLGKPSPENRRFDIWRILTEVLCMAGEDASYWLDYIGIKNGESL